MKALVFSDIHGSLHAASFIARQMNTTRPDALFLLGDILYHGPRNPLPQNYDPKAVVGVLNDFKDDIIAIRGNCDSEVDAMVLDFPLAPSFSWCYADGVRYFLTHGHVFGPENPPPLSEGDVVLSGHTHVPTADTCEGVYRCNPGSISLPKEGHPPSYGLIDNGEFLVLTTTGEVYLRLLLC